MVVVVTVTSSAVDDDVHGLFLVLLKWNWR